MTYHRNSVIDSFKELGWQINFEKCKLEASLFAVFVGSIITTDGDRGMWIKVQAQKIRKLKRCIRIALERKTITVRSLAKITGQCISMTKAIVPTKLLLRNTFRVLKGRDSWDLLVTLTAAAEKNLKWWLGAFIGWNRAALDQKSIDVQIETDVSKSGWVGAVLYTEEAAGIWPIEIRFDSSNFRKLTAIYMTLLTFRKKMRNKKVQVLTDNAISVACVNNLGGPCKKLSNMMEAIWTHCNSLRIQLSACHLAGKSNIRVDLLSQICSPYEWQLNTRIFKVLDKMWGPHMVDWCASMQTTQLDQYNSLHWNPMSKGIDC